MAGIRVRQDVWNLSKTNKWEPTLLWYAKAIAEMQTRPISDPTSWRYQAAIHDYISGNDPLASPDDVLPNDADRFWMQCQHVSWFFLPWHRMFLFHFEQIVAATVVKLGGPADWSLPYWNYSDAANPDARKLPPAFYDLALPDGTPNPLRVEQRDRGNDGRILASPVNADINQCLNESAFAADTQGGSPGFGGPQTAFNHGEGNVVGMLEATPHGNMHVAVGGWMGSFETAGLDPIFWLHHSNIDRLWNVWRARDPGHQNPSGAQWLTAVSFDFHDADGNIVSHTADQVVDSTANPLSYKYEDESDPIAGADLAPRILSVAERSIPEMVGATSKPLTLSGQPASTSFAVNPPTGPARTLALAGGTPKIYLHVENITGPRHHTSYSVYLNLPPDGNASNHPELLAGSMPMFGVAQASQATDKHAGSGLHYAFEVSHIVRKLEARGDWDAKNIRVTFIPDYETPPARTLTSGQPTGAIQVGRISMYHKISIEEAFSEYYLTKFVIPNASFIGGGICYLLAVKLRTRSTVMMTLQQNEITASVQRFTWRHPEWWVYALSFIAWLTIVLSLMTGMPHHHHASNSLMNEMRNWMLMVAAMMLPLVATSARNAAAMSLWSRRYRAIATFVLGYLIIWLIVGVFISLIISIHWIDPKIAIAASFVLAIAWQFTSIKRRALMSCHGTMPLAPNGWRADVDCIRYGWRIGKSCVVSCWAGMLLCTAMNHNILVMICAAGIGIVERYTRLNQRLYLLSFRSTVFVRGICYSWTVPQSCRPIADSSFSLRESSE